MELQDTDGIAGVPNSGWISGARHRLFIVVACLFAVIHSLGLTGAEAAAPVDFADLELIFFKHCVECHGAKDPDGSLVLETYETLLKGGESGPTVVAGKSAESLLIQFLEGRAEKKGKRLVMPPGKRDKLSKEQIALFKDWIDQGTKPPSKLAAADINPPRIAVRGEPRRSVHSLQYAPGPNLLAVGRHDVVELLNGDTRAVTRTLAGHRGDVSAMVFNSDGTQLFAASGRPAQFGEIRQWNVADGALIRTVQAHKDAIYALALSPDGATLATGSYDQKIMTWSVSDAKLIHTLAVHNGAIFDLSFRADGKILASASLDRTAKLWDPAAGQRRDTLSQSLKELYAVSFSRDGRQLWTAGADNRIRIYQVSELAAETTNPLLDARFAHEGAVLKLALSRDGKRLASAADDRTVKLWDSEGLKETASLERQPDWPSALAFLKEDRTLAVGRMDGSIGYYETGTGKASAGAKPELLRIEPRGVQAGSSGLGRFVGKQLSSITSVRSASPKVRVAIAEEKTRSESELWVEWSAEAGAEPGPVEIWGVGEGVETARKILHIDDLPQRFESSTTNVIVLESSFWGRLDPAGDSDEIEFDAKAGQALVADLRTASLGSKTMPSITVVDAKGRVLVESRGGDGPEPLVGFKTSSAGRHRIVVRERTSAGSADHDYRVSLSARPYVTGTFPLVASRTGSREVYGTGIHLPKGLRMPVTGGEGDFATLKFDGSKLRSRRPIKVPLTDFQEVLEREPNDAPSEAQPLKRGEAVNGRFASASPRGTDVDCFSFEATEGESLVIETFAARYDSPADTRIEVLWPDGKPVDRVRLQAVRNTAINFRPIDSTSGGARLDNYEEMELNQWLYLKGEVVRLFRFPQGPDSEMLFYSSNGKRRGYFDTTAVSHALEEPGYIVSVEPPGSPPGANGLPSFTLPFANDDDAERKAGVDSRLMFKAPKAGNYLVRVRESRGAQGERFAYRLVVREPKPDFKLSLGSDKLEVPRGSGQAFTYSAERSDGFDGDIQIDLEGAPAGIEVSTPLVIQAGHNSASGVVFAAEDFSMPGESNIVRFTAKASALIGGVRLEKAVAAPTRVTIKEPPKLQVTLGPAGQGASSEATKTGLETVTIRAGQTVPAMIRVKRKGHDDLITFTVENLPHGVIVDHIGLNGVLMPKGEHEREVFITAPRWVEKQERLCYAIENQAGKQTSRPVLLRVLAN